ncbi:hypothetical protein AT15_09915 [Kosmotoga arenicorallina S304]|uniref:Carbohydrate kinase PfkB domain-containing protein n=1 Tax=Kosmotoga arenicorallina S304 TaxID=1453497 RepID=A0A176K1G8_9BACT|nr:carbohydrate kinase [Kosmotoga arenicorallina]OAA30728.1 hypothetical protein AT15_09915 [Kosmotoga arenicorallina S304]
MKKILIVGELLVDMISEEYASDLSKVRKFERSFAGSPGNLAANLQGLGIEAILLAALGNDPFGKGYLKWLNSIHVNTSYISVVNHHTSMVFVTKSRGTPQFMPVRGADYHLSIPHNLDELFNDVYFLHFTSWPVSRKPARTTVKKLLELARDKGIYICLDPNYSPVLWKEPKAKSVKIMLEFMNNVYLAKPSLDDSERIFGKLSAEKYLELYHSFGVKNVLLTLGAEGVLISDGKCKEALPSLTERVVDTTGAGDAFWSGLYCGLLKGLDIFEAAKLGNAAAAFRIENENKSLPIPEYEKLIELLSERG